MPESLGNPRRSILLGTWGPLIALLVLTAATYLTTVNYEYSWDDELFLSKSPAMARPESMATAFSVDFWGLTENTSEPGGSPFYRPLALSWLVLEKAVLGGSVALLRSLHSLWHIANVLLVFLLARRLLGATGGGTGAGPLFAATTFAALPYTVDTVMFLTSVSDLMALFFVLIACLVFCSWLERPRVSSAIAILLAAAAALVSKESAASLPIVLALIYWARYTGGTTKPVAVLFGTLLGVIVVFLIVRSTVVAPISPELVPGFVTSLPANLALAFRWALVPVPLVLEDAATPSWTEPLWWLGAAGIALLAFLAVRFRRHPLPFVCAGFWLATVSPSLVTIQWTGVFAPRYLYLPATGLALLIGWIAGKLARRWQALLAVFVVVLGVSTLARTAVWQDGLTLWSVELSRTPESLQALTNVGNILARRGQHRDAIAIQLKAAEIATRANRPCQAGFAYSNAATILVLHIGNNQQALELFEKTIRLCPTKASNAWIGIAQINAHVGNLKQALIAADRAIATGPPSPRFYLLRGIVLDALERDDEARSSLEKARSLAVGAPVLSKQIDELLVKMDRPGRPFDQPTQPADVD